MNQQNTDTSIPSGIELTRKIGRRLQQARTARGMSLSQVSAETGGQLSKSRISNYEQGLRRMPIEAAVILAQALGGITPSWLLCLEDEAER
jgi:transcriptional regulator with XRE-family HTH domain